MLLSVLSQGLLILIPNSNVVEIVGLFYSNPFTTNKMRGVDWWVLASLQTVLRPLGR